MFSLLFGTVQNLHKVYLGSINFGGFMGMAFDGLLGGHLLFAIIWIVTSFASAVILFRVLKTPINPSLLKNAILIRTLVAASGGLTVIIGAGFYYYVEFYRKSYAISSSGLPLVDAGALVGLIAFIWQTLQGAGIRRTLKAQIGSLSSTTTASSGSATPNQSQIQSKLPSRAMLIAPPILLLVAFAIMLGGAMM
jgi:hypothetical protein